MEAQGTWVLFYSGVGSVLSQQHRLATSSLFFVCPQSVEQGKNGAKIGHMVTYFFATRSANKEKRDCP